MAGKFRKEREPQINTDLDPDLHPRHLWPKLLDRRDRHVAASTTCDDCDLNIACSG